MRFLWTEVNVIVKPNYESETAEGCAEVIEEDQKNSLNYEDAAEVTADGKYRCRDCGMLFDTLEAHDAHHRTVHSRVETFPHQGMTS